MPFSYLYVCRVHVFGLPVLQYLICKISNTEMFPTRDSNPVRVLPKTLKIEPTSIVLGARHKQSSRENKPVNDNWKKGCRCLNLNQWIRNWTVKPHPNLNRTSTQQINQLKTTFQMYAFFEVAQTSSCPCWCVCDTPL